MGTAGGTGFGVFDGGLDRRRDACALPGERRRTSALDEVKAARVTTDYDTRYGRTTGFWTTDRFVEAVYNSLKQPRKR